MTDNILPAIINLELTNACNLSCVFCDHPDLARTMNIGSMETSLLEAVLSGLGGKHYHEIGLVGLGEPLMDRRLAEHLEIIRKHAPYFNIISLNTNILALTPELAALICLSPVTNVTISLNASNPEAYRRLMGADGFQRAICNIEMFIETRHRLGTGQEVAIQLMASDISAEEELRHVLKENTLNQVKLFIREVYAKPTLLHRTAPLQMRHSDIERYPCWSLYSRVYVDVRGNVYPCTIGNDCYRETSHLCLGNVNEGTVIDIFNNEAANAARHRAEQGGPAFPECKNCNIWSMLPNHFSRDANKRFRPGNGPARRRGMDWQTQHEDNT